MPEESPLTRLLGGALEAAEDPRRWSALLRELSSALRAPVVVLVAREPARGDPGEVYEVGAEGGAGGLLELFGRGSDAQEARSQTGTVLIERLAIAASPLTSRSLPVAMRREEALLAFRCVLAPAPSGGRPALYGLRPETLGPYESSEVELLRLLLPHLERALALRRRIAEGDVERDCSREALDRIPIGVAFLDAEARLRWASRRAREILGRRDGLALDAQGLRAASPAEGAALRQAVAEAAAGSSPVCRILTLHRASGKRPYGAMLAPLRAGSHGSARGALVALFLNDPEGEACTDVDAVRELHGLTPTEARIAAALANGRSPEETAGALGMRLSTLRHHLKHVFAKTETSRQASLVRLLLGGPATLRRV